MLPEASTFCPYCGASAESPQPQATFPFSADASAAMQGKKKNSKQKKEKKCEQCGAPLGKKDKVCPVCGTLILRKPANLRPALIAMSVAICLLLCGTGYFMLEMFQGNDAITRLEGEKAELITQQEHDQIELKRYERDIKSLEGERDYWQNQSAEWRDAYDRSIVIVRDGSSYYHKINCFFSPLFNKDGYHRFTLEQAKNLGYRGCSSCNPD